MTAHALPRAGAHPAFAPFARWLNRHAPDAMPAHSALNAWAREAALALPDGRPLRFVPPTGRMSAQAYERRITERAEIATRTGSLHDVMNALAWIVFPRTKAALNALHVAEADGGSYAGARGPCRDAATLLDESGILVACADPVLAEMWRAHAWREVFHERRDRVARTFRVAVIGHGLLAKCSAPFRALTARALVLAVDAAALPADAADRALMLDHAAAARLRLAGSALAPPDLLPLPVAALPGWDAEGIGARLYDDAAVFRPRPARSSSHRSGRATLAQQDREL